ncbi:glycosyltransferase [Helicobacter mesocricetorum]|uniref:glycosyltransferase n=1 Tax=Helicobacter mesocricetorum TaxID=87012 RepID=UPI000CF1AB41|nr:glycosyltransferase [Helicobacter mesocricetorum]
MKNIFMVVKNISSVGGINRVVANLCYLFSKEYKITIVSCNTTQESPTFEMPKEVSLIHFSKLYPDFSTKSFLDKLKFSYRFNKLLPKDTQNFVIVHQLLFPFFKAKNTTYIRFYHGNFETGFKKYLRKTPLFPPRIRLFDVLVILSSKQIHLFSKLHKNTKVIPNFLNDYPKTTTNPLQKVVLSVGRLSEEKGFLRLIDIWAILAKNPSLKEWKLHIVGDGELKETIYQKIHTLGLEDSILLKPFTKEIDKEYLKASIYALSSYYESFSMVLLESGSYALPSVAFDVPNGPSEIIQENSGFLVADDDLEGFANKLQSLMENDFLRKTLGGGAREIVLKKFTKESIYPLWKQILK